MKNEVSRANDSEHDRVDENDHSVCPSPVQIRPVRDITILLEKLSPTITRHSEPEEIDEVLCTSLVQSDEEECSLESSANETQISTVFKGVPVREVRILLDKLPDTVFTSLTKTPLSSEIATNHVEVSPIDDVARISSFESIEKLHENVNISSEQDQSTEKPRKELLTPSRETACKQPSISGTPTVVPESVSTPVTTPVPGAQISGKKTPKSLDIPLRRITIVKSKFTKMSRALESPSEKSPVKIRPTSTYLTSPLAKLKNWKTNKTVAATRKSLNSMAGNIVSGESSRSSTGSTSSSVSHVDKPIFVRKSVHYASDCKSPTESSNKVKSVVAKKIPNRTAAISERENSTPLPSIQSPASARSTTAYTDATSPSSRGLLLTAKSLAASPHAPKMMLVKSSSKSDCGKSIAAKSPSNRGRLLTDQSLASSSKHHNSSTADKKIRPSSSAGATLHRSHSNVSSSPRERQEVSHKQKWSSAGDLLKLSSMDTESDSSDDLSSVAIPLDPTPATGVFSNSKTCSAILSTLKTADRNKSKSVPKKLPQWSTFDIFESMKKTSKKTPDSTKIRTPTIKSTSRSQPDLSEKLAGVQIDSTKPSYAPIAQSTYLSSIQKKPFHIPKVKPGGSNFYKTAVAPSSSLPRSGFTPSPPTKSSVNRPVLDKSMYDSTSYVPTTNSRQVPPYSSQLSNSKPLSKPSTTTESCFKTPLKKPFYSSSSTTKSSVQTTSSKPSYTSSSSNSATIKPYFQTASSKPPHTSSSSNSSTIRPIFPATSSKPYTSSSLHSATMTKPSSTKLPHTPNSHPSRIIPPYIPSSHSTTTKPQNSSSSQITFAKPSTPISYTPPIKPYVPSAELKSHTSKTSSSTPTPSKSLSSNISVTDFKPLKINTASSGHSSHKSKPRPFKTAYMSSRSSNNTSFSKCLPSGPQYSPTYSKYLQNGFSYLPNAKYDMPKPAKPLSPGISSVLQWSTVKPWMNKESVPPPNGPSNSMASSSVTSNPSYSPLCPEF